MFCDVLYLESENRKRRSLGVNIIKNSDVGFTIHLKIFPMDIRVLECS
jgi:hypothetical protein